MPATDRRWANAELRPGMVARRVIFGLTVLTAFVCGGGSCKGQQEKRSYPYVVAREAVVYVPDEPGPGPEDRTGKHVTASEDEWGDHILNTYTNPPMQMLALPPGRVQIGDPTYGIAAVTINLPAGWKMEGSVHRDIACAGESPEVAFRMTGPDGMVLEMMTPFFTGPQGTMPRSFKQHCGVATSERLSAAEILTRYLLPSLEPGARVMGAPEPTPGMEEWVREANRKTDSSTMNGEDMRVRVAYSRDGKKYEAWIGAQTLFFHGAGHYESSQTTVFRAVAPEGRLEEVVKIGNALKPESNPEWIKKEEERAKSALSGGRRGEMQNGPQG